MVQNRTRYWRKGSLPYFLSSQLFHSDFPTPTASFHGQTVIVTGANVGLGFEAAKHITRLGVAKVILAVRTPEKGHRAKENIERATQCGSGVVEVWQLDLSSSESVKAFAKRANAGLTRLDVLLENAGVATRKFVETEGDESTIKTNVISTFLLAFLMLPKLKETAEKHNVRPTLTIVSSEVHYWTKFPEGRKAAEGAIFEDLSDPKKADMGSRYPLSKLLEVFVVRKMAALRPSSEFPITINLVNPGLCESELAREAGPLHPLQLMKLVLARTTEVGSRTLVHAASSGPTTHGQYLSDCDVEQPSKTTTTPEGIQLGDRVYKELCERLEKQAPGCTANL